MRLYKKKKSQQSPLQTQPHTHTHTHTHKDGDKDLDVSTCRQTHTHRHTCFHTTLSNKEGKLNKKHASTASVFGWNLLNSSAGSASLSARAEKIWGKELFRWIDLFLHIIDILCLKAQAASCNSCNAFFIDVLRSVMQRFSFSYSDNGWWRNVFFEEQWEILVKTDSINSCSQPPAFALLLFNQTVWGEQYKEWVWGSNWSQQ